jgi:phage gp36-like protein
MTTPYITQQDLYDLFGQTDIDNAVSDTEVALASIIATTCDEVDAYVSQVSALPPTAKALSMVKQSVADLVRFRLYRDAASELIRSRADDSIKFLTAIATRKIAIDIAETPDIADDPDTPEDESLNWGGEVKQIPRLHGIF